MKQRTFLTTLALFLIFFNLGISIVSVAMFRDTVNRAEDRSLSAHYFIASSLIKDLQVVKSRGTDIDASLSSLLQPYMYLSGDNKAGLVFYKNNRLVFSSKDATVLQSNFMEPPGNGNCLATIRKIDGRTYVVVSGKLPVPYDFYTLVYFYDTTEAINSSIPIIFWA